MLCLPHTTKETVRQPMVAWRSMPFPVFRRTRLRPDKVHAEVVQKSQIWGTNHALAERGGKGQLAEVRLLRGHGRDISVLSKW